MNPNIPLSFAVLRQNSQSLNTIIFTDSASFDTAVAFFLILWDECIDLFHCLTALLMCALYDIDAPTKQYQKLLLAVTEYKPRRMHTIDAAHCYIRFDMMAWSISVCVCVCLYVTGMNPAKTAGPIEMPK